MSLNQPDDKYNKPLELSRSGLWAQRQLQWLCSLKCEQSANIGIKQHAIKLSQWPSELNALSIIHLTDPHLDADSYWGQEEALEAFEDDLTEWLVKAVINEIIEPEKVVWSLGGDYVSHTRNETQDLVCFEGFLQSVANAKARAEEQLVITFPHHCWATHGNHDNRRTTVAPEVDTLLTQYGYTLLDGQRGQTFSCTTHEIAGQALQVIGGPDYLTRQQHWTQNKQQIVLQQADPTLPTLCFAHHLPKPVTDVLMRTSQAATLAIGGHTHGGQLTPLAGFWGFHGVKYFNQRQAKFVGKGLGSSPKFNTPVPRFGCAPEVSVVQVYSAD